MQSRWPVSLAGGRLSSPQFNRQSSVERAAAQQHCRWVSWSTGPSLCLKMPFLWSLVFKITLKTFILFLLKRCLRSFLQPRSRHCDPSPTCCRCKTGTPDDMSLSKGMKAPQLSEAWSPPGATPPWAGGGQVGGTLQFTPQGSCPSLSP